MKRNIILLIIIMVTASCEKVLDIRIDEKQKKLVVNGIIDPNDSIRVHLSKSRSIVDTTGIEWIEDAQISLFEGNTLFGDLYYKGNGFYLADVLPKKGMEYRIEVFAEPYGRASAKCLVPEPVEFLGMDTIWKQGEWGDSTLVISMEFNDPEGVKNYYYIDVYALQFKYDYRNDVMLPEIEVQELYYGLDDPLINESTDVGGKSFFTDELFDGKRKMLNLSLTSYNFINDNVIVVYVFLHSPNEEYFKYAKSYELNAQNGGNPFAEPVQVYSNVDGGLGIFGAVSEARDSLVMMDIDLETMNLLQNYIREY